MYVVLLNVCSWYQLCRSTRSIEVRVHIVVSFVFKSPSHSLTFCIVFSMTNDSGCHNDANNMKNYLSQVHGFRESEMLILMDDGHHHAPTRRNLEDAFARICQYSVAGDVVFVHYSGHVSSTIPVKSVACSGQSFIHACCRAPMDLGRWIATFNVSCFFPFHSSVTGWPCTRYKWYVTQHVEMNAVSRKLTG
jgi:hypothetical protein